MKKIVFLILIGLISCKKNHPSDFSKVKDLPFADVVFDENIKNSKEIIDLKGKKVKAPFPEKDSLIDKTNTIYWTIQNGDKDKPFTFYYNECVAILYPNELLISFSSNSGLGGSGNHVNILNNKFGIKPFYWNDIGGDEKNDLYQISYQKLILDKKNYKIGDSIFGKIDAEILKLFPEVNIKEGNRKIFHEDKFIQKTKVSGFFRLKIKKPIEINKKNPEKFGISIFLNAHLWRVPTHRFFFQIFLKKFVIILIL